MRKAFIETLSSLARVNDKLILLTGDLGFSVFENFRDEFKNRFINAGVAEQNLIGVATGLALSGKTVFVYSIIPFVTFRCLEQIRNDICMQNSNVKIIGMGAGFHYGSAGATHFALEDIAVLRSFPNLNIVCPANSCDTIGAIRAAVLNKGPFYIRLGKDHEIEQRKAIPDFSFGKAMVVDQGTDVTIFSTGAILHEVKQCADLLRNSNISPRIVNLHTLMPFDIQSVIRAGNETRAIFAVEEHSIIGGLGSSIAEVLAESGCHVLFRRFGLGDQYPKSVGNRRYLMSLSRLSPNDLAVDILRLLKTKPHEKGTANN